MKEMINKPSVLVILGMIPAVGAVNYATGALLMGIGTIIVTVLTALIMKAFAGRLTDKEKLFAYLFTVCTLTTLLRMLMQAFFIGSFGDVMSSWNLLAVNAMVVTLAAVMNSEGRADTRFTLNCGLLFARLLFLQAVSREVFGAGAFFGIELPFPAGFRLPLLSGTTGGLILLGIIAAGMNAFLRRKEGRDA